MDDIKSWGLILVFVSAGCMIYYFLLPSGSVSKTAKAVLSSLVFGVICMPLFSVIISVPDMSFEFSSAPDMEDFDGFVLSQARKATESIIEECIKKYTDEEYKTEIFIDISDDSFINISKVNIIFQVRPAHEKDIRQELYDKLGIMPDIFTEKVNE